MTSDKANHRFLLSELIRRDFIKKYKRTTFGILWSALSPLFLLLTMDVVFGTFFRPQHAALHDISVLRTAAVQLFLGSHPKRHARSLR